MTPQKDREYTLQLGIPREFPRTRRGSSCRDSDGLAECACTQDNCHKRIEDCSYYGRPLEPLAFYLPAFSDVNKQEQSPMYDLPKEIRDLIFEYALANDSVPSKDSDNGFRRNMRVYIPKANSACSLLQTCKAVYLEAYRLPMQVNGYFAYRTQDWTGRRDGSRWDELSCPEFARISPWQYALIQRIDISMQQESIEGSRGLRSELQFWKPALRHTGAYVSPRFYSTTRSLVSRNKPEELAHAFALYPRQDSISGKRLEDGDRVTLERSYVQRYNDPEDQDRIGQKYVECNFTARAMVARTLTHLTLRISRTDWWTWTDDPDTLDNDKQLALDPACGGEKPRPLLNDMLSLAAARRNGIHPAYDKPQSETWGAAIGALPDLKIFELILETFKPKKQQLETVVECAKTWKFPLIGTQYGLICDGNIEVLQWTFTTETDKESDFAEEVAHQAHDSRQEMHSNITPYVPPSSPPPPSLRQRLMRRLFKCASTTTRARGSEMLQNALKTRPKSMPILPQWEPPATDWLQPTKATPPLYEDNFFRHVSWVRECTEFEVRVVRFRRRRAD